MAFDDWDKLCYGVERGLCVLFLGQDLPLGAVEEPQRPPLSLLADRFLEAMKSGDESPTSEAHALPSIAHRFLAEEGEMATEDQITRWHHELLERPSALHDDLAALPFRLIVTTSPDPLMEAALTRARRQPSIDHYHYRGKNSELIPEPTVDSPVLFYLYGRPTDPDSVILTETQLMRYLTGLLGNEPPLPHNLNAALTASRQFLFLGFGVQHWPLRILLHYLKVLRSRKSGFALEPASTSTSPGIEDAILFYRDFRIDIHQDDIFRFARELRHRFTDRQTGESAAPAVPPAAWPTSVIKLPVASAAEDLSVFICHASEDNDTASALHSALERAGLTPWLDQKALRGGDHWDDLIKETIMEVDYFIVLNSSSLVQKRQQVSYVNKEIKEALRAEDYRMGRFIIPVKLDEEPLRPELDRYHAVEAGGDRGFREVVRAIKKDLADR